MSSNIMVHVGSFPVISFTFLLACVSIFIPVAVQGKRVDVPTVENLIRRWHAAAAVISDYVYIDGGEISQFEDGLMDDGVIYQVNSTLSIDISTSWTTSNVSFRTIQKPNPPRNSPMIWIDKTDKGGFYSWGGVFSMGRGLTKSEMWKFSADGQGGGSWSLVEDFVDPEVFKKLQSTEMGAYANTDTKGFLIGGFASPWTQLGLEKHQIIPGMVTFDMRTKEIGNGTAADEVSRSSPFETLIGGKAHFIPPFVGTRSDRGLVLVLGGHRSYVDRSVSLENSPGFDLKNLTFFDPETRERYWQIATGDIPPSPRSQFCVTGFAVTGGGYDVFIFGGYNAGKQNWHQDAYILSLPGFVWTKVPTPPAGPRYCHVCVSLGNQVLSIGGVAATAKSVDTAPQGLLLFDMTAQTWKETYDATAKDYERANGLKDWYQNVGLQKADWSSNRVKALFVRENGAEPPGGSSNGQPNATMGHTGPTGLDLPGISGSAELPESREEVKVTQASVAAIAGAAVGGVSGLTLIIALVIWLIYHHKTAKKQRANNDKESAAGTKLGGFKKSQIPVNTTEADTSHDHWELPSKPENDKTFNNSPQTLMERAEVSVNHDHWELPVAPIEQSHYRLNRATGRIEMDVVHEYWELPVTWSP